MRELTLAALWPGKVSVVNIISAASPALLSVPTVFWASMRLPSRATMRT